MLTFLLAPAWADPHCPSTWTEVAASLDGLDASWGVSAETFATTVVTARAQVACLGAVLTPEQAARVHRARGLEAYLARDLDGARAAFAAARAADPAYTFPATMVPTGNPVRTLYDSSAGSGASTPLAPPASGRVMIDGIPAHSRPTDRAALFQLDHGPVDTAWLAPADPTPTYRVRGQGFRLPLLLAGAVAAGGGVALYVVADNLAKDAPIPASHADVEALASTNHSMVIGSGGLGVAAVGLLTTAVIWGRW